MIEDYWTTPEGIRQRVSSLSQIFNYKVINNAIKIVGPLNGAKWMEWVLHPEASKSGPCDDCIAASRGGQNGYYRTSWFSPDMPVHPNCLCEWKIYLVDPRVGLDEVDRSMMILMAERARYKPIRFT